MAFVCCTRNWRDMTGPCCGSQSTTVRYVRSRCIFEVFWKIKRHRTINLLIDRRVVMTKQRVNHICVPTTCTVASLLRHHYLLLNCLHSFWYFVGVHLHLHSVYIKQYWTELLYNLLWTHSFFYIFNIYYVLNGWWFWIDCIVAIGVWSF